MYAPTEPLSALATRQHGVVATWQLVDLGMHRSYVSRIAARGWLNKVHRGVYAVGHEALPFAGRCMAAVLAAGPGAVLSGVAAAALIGLVPRGDVDVDEIVVLAPGSRRARAGIRIRRAPTLRDSDHVTFEGVPIAPIPRILLDCADVMAIDRTTALIAEAAFRRRLEPCAVRDMIRRSGSWPPASRLRKALRSWEGGSRGTCSALEDSYAAAFRAAGREPPPSNVRLRIGSGRVRPDFLVRELGLVVETDGRAAHGLPEQQWRDAERTRLLESAGWTVERCRWHDHEEHARSVMRRLDMLHDAAGA